MAAIVLVNTLEFLSVAGIQTAREKAPGWGVDWRHMASDLGAFVGQEEGLLKSLGAPDVRALGDKQDCLGPWWR